FPRPLAVITSISPLSEPSLTATAACRVGFSVLLEGFKSFGMVSAMFLCVRRGTTGYDDTKFSIIQGLRRKNAVFEPLPARPLAERGQFRYAWLPSTGSEQSKL